MQSSTSRPRGVTIIGIFDILQAPCFILVTLLWFSDFTVILSFVFGIIDICVGIGLLKRKKWAWKIAVILSVVGIGIGVLDFYFPQQNLLGQIIGIQESITDVIILYYLLRPQVRTYFGKAVL